MTLPLIMTPFEGTLKNNDPGGIIRVNTVLYTGGGKSSLTDRLNLLTLCIEAKTENRQSG